MTIIRRNYSTNFYRWPITEEKEHTSILKWEIEENDPLVVFHPFLSFDPINNLYRQISMLDDKDYFAMNEEDEISSNFWKKTYAYSEDLITPIVHETIRTNFNFFENLESLLTRIELDFKIQKGNWLWDDTGFWSAKDNKYGYIGLSEDSAKQLWKSCKELILCFVVSNPSMLIEFTADKKTDDGFYTNVYYANKFLPFPELIDVIHRTLDELGSWTTLKLEKQDEKDIFDKYPERNSVFMTPESSAFSVFPEWAIPNHDDPPPGSEWLYAVVVKNKFFSIGRTMPTPMGYVILIMSGGWLNSDFNDDKKHFQFIKRIRKLENCYLVNLTATGYETQESEISHILKRLLLSP